MAPQKKILKKRPQNKSIVSTPVYTLPTSKSSPSTKLSDFSWLIYGDKKIGKTSLCSCFPKALLYAFEPGAKSLEIFQVDIPTWEAALAYNEQLFTTDNDFENIIIDTGKIAYDRNMQFICDQEKIKHPADQPYGKGWSTTNKSFEKLHLDILNNGIGLVITAHEKMVERELSSGLKETRVEPDLSGSSLNFYHGMVDIIARYHFIGNKRFLTIRGSGDETAGTRMTKNFLTPEGERVYRIPMGDSEEEAYANLVKAFNNKQTKTYKNLEEISPVKPSRKKRTPAT